MARIIAKQPNGLYCIYSTITDSIIGYNYTKEEWIKYRIEEESKRIREDLKSVFEDVDSGKVHGGTYGMDFKEMIDNHTEYERGEDFTKKQIIKQTKQ